MKVLFDYQAFHAQTHGGVSRCFWELYKHLTNGVEAEISIKESNNAYLDLPGVHPVGHVYEHFVKTGYWPCKGRVFDWYNRIIGRDYYNWNRQTSIEALKRGDFDVFHPTYFNDYFLEYLNGKPFVLTIHDMIPERYPEFFTRNDSQILLKRKLVPLASAVIAVSETTKSDILRFLQVPEEKVHVIHHGANFMRPTIDECPFSFPYILYVGDRMCYKRFKEWLPHLRLFLVRHPEVKVVCTGMPFNEVELRLMERLEMSDRFVQYFVKDDQEFYTIYHHALAFVYTSEYEGFGIPILEAYQADCPVMLNRSSCFPEVAGDAAIYFTLDVHGSNFLEQMERVYYFSEAERASLLNRQRERLKIYSWEKATTQLAEVYQKVI